MCLAACAVPLAPGYHVVKESREIQFVATSPPALQIQSTYKLQNSGTADLKFLDVTLPIASVYGRSDLHAELDGHAAILAPLPTEFQADSPNDLRLSFDSDWKQRAQHDLSIDYTLRAPIQMGARITLNNDDFHLGSRGGFAVLEPPKHLLAPFPKRPDEMYYTVRVPKDFRVLARGTPAGKKANGQDVDYRYRLHADDLSIYVVAGRYSESKPAGNDGPIFWTMQPASIEAARARAIGEAWNTLQTDFGSLDKNIRAPHIVEVANLPEHISGEGGVAAVPFPGGALVSSTALAPDLPSDEFAEVVSHALAHNWLGDEIYPAANATLVLGEGLPEYAMLVIDEERGGQDARVRRIARYLNAYDTGLTMGKEETLATATMNDPPAERRIALAKALLFFAALEDQCGRQAMREGIKEIVTLLRGQEVTYPALRAALEEKSGKNLAPTFRLWLNEKGIPDDFRARYQ